MKETLDRANSSVHFQLTRHLIHEAMASSIKKDFDRGLQTIQQGLDKLPSDFICRQVIEKFKNLIEHEKQYSECTDKDTINSGLSEKMKTIVEALALAKQIRDSETLHELIHYYYIIALINSDATVLAWMPLQKIGGEMHHELALYLIEKADDLVQQKKYNSASTLLKECSEWLHGFKHKQTVEKYIDIVKSHEKFPELNGNSTEAALIDRHNAIDGVLGVIKRDKRIKQLDLKLKIENIQILLTLKKYTQINQITSADKQPLYFNTIARHLISEASETAHKSYEEAIAYLRSALEQLDLGDCKKVVEQYKALFELERTEKGSEKHYAKIQEVLESLTSYDWSKHFSKELTDEQTLIGIELRDFPTANRNLRDPKASQALHNKAASEALKVACRELKTSTARCQSYLSKVMRQLGNLKHIDLFKSLFFLLSPEGGKTTTYRGTKDWFKDIATLLEKTHSIAELKWFEEELIQLVLQHGATAEHYPSIKLHIDEVFKSPSLRQRIYNQIAFRAIQLGEELRTNSSNYERALLNTQHHIAGYGLADDPLLKSYTQMLTEVSQATGQQQLINLNQAIASLENLIATLNTKGLPNLDSLRKTKVDLYCDISSLELQNGKTEAVTQALDKAQGIALAIASKETRDEALKLIDQKKSFQMKVK
jgi:hypothetical protein